MSRRLGARTAQKTQDAGPKAAISQARKPSDATASHRPPSDPAGIAEQEPKSPQQKMSEARNRMREMQMRHRLEARKVNLAARLNLTPAQAAQLQKADETAETSRRNAFMAAMQNGTPRDVAQMRKISQDRDAAIESTLSDEQKTAYQEVKAEERAEMVEGMATQLLSDMSSRASN